MASIQFYENRPEHIRKRLTEIEAEERFRRRVFWRAIGLFIGSTLVGLAGMALGLMSTSSVWGPTMFWFGVLTADLGFAATLVWSYRQAEP